MHRIGDRAPRVLREAKDGGAASVLSRVVVRRAP